MDALVHLEGGRRRVLPKLLRRGSLLLHQQCWLWGCDIRHQDGNALGAHGFTREPDPGGTRSTQYTMSLPHGRMVRLWGSGFYFGGTDEGIFLNRFLFEPRFVRVWPGWQDPAVMTRAPRYVSLPLLRDACCWIAEYEAWVMQHCGAVYRRTALSRGPFPEADADLVGMLWRRLADDLDQLHAGSA